MHTNDHTISIRVPAEIFVKLKQFASQNHTSMSEISRDLVMKSLVIPTDEHEFLSRSQWGNAVRQRDGHHCVECGSPRNIEAHHIVPVYQGGRNVLSNGQTLCDKCHSKAHSSDTYVKEENPIPASWRKKLYTVLHSRDTDEETFWKEQLACFYTKRKRPNSDIVQRYLGQYLVTVDTDIVRDTLLSLCPSPDTIQNFPSRHTSTKELEHFSPPDFVRPASSERERGASTVP